MINCLAVVLCSHFVVMNTWGFTNSFGAFQTYFTDTLDRSPSTISWIGSMQIFLLFFLGTITGRLTDAGHFRVVFFIGSLATVAGIFASSFCHRFGEYFVALGIAVGVGNGCLFCPMLTVMSSYFDQRRAIAIGVAACGSASGGLVYSGMARQFVPSIGFPWTMRAIALIQLALLTVANIHLRPRVPAKPTVGLIDWPAFRDTSYNYYAAASFFVSEPSSKENPCVPSAPRHI
jgi:MFS family permease